MKENIEQKLIIRRKLIIEIRFDPNPKFLDNRGKLLEELNSLKIIENSYWSIGEGIIYLSDSNIKENEKIYIIVEMNRFLFVDSSSSSNDEFKNKFEKVKKAVFECFNETKIKRIGCRIFGIYKTQSNKFEKISENFQNLFNNKLFIEDFDVKDLSFTINYQNGRYLVGPVNKNDVFYKDNFPYDDAEEVGFGIDTDNYMLNLDNILSKDKIIDVFNASLSVEKHLVDMLKGL